MRADIVRPPLLLERFFCDDFTSSVVGESITTVLVSIGKLGGTYRKVFCDRKMEKPPLYTETSVTSFHAS